jgi:beta-glucosidase
MDTTLTPDGRAEILILQMTLDEKIAMVHGLDGSYVGNVPGNARLGIPALRLQDGPAGVGGGTTGVTAFPAPLAVAASWDVVLMRQYAAALAAEERGKGTNVQLAPMMNMTRVPQAGRNFEGYGEDPYLAAAMAAAGVLGIQSQGVIATAKHFVDNDQETDRDHATSDLDERTQNEIYYPPFRAAVRAGVGAVMASYNRINGTWACDSQALDTVLRKRWGFQGFVMTDWWATFSTVAAANNGLDMEMPQDLRFSGWLKSAVQSEAVPEARLNEMVRRILTSMFRMGLFDNPTTGTIDANVRRDEHAQLARDAAARGIVLLKNAGVLPLDASSLRSITVIGSAGAKLPISVGDGSARVVLPYQVTPLLGITNRVSSSVKLSYSQGDGGQIAAAVDVAKNSDVAIVFVGERSSEGVDRPGLALPGDQNDLVAAVAAANSRTIVVLNVAAPMVLPWIDSVAATLVAWFPGQENGNAVASVLFGEVNPSGKLPITFPRTADQIPVSTLAQFPGVRGHVAYSEKLLMGYRWYDANGVPPLFPFGHGLSYTTFAYNNLTIRSAAVPKRIDVALDLTNTGNRPGAETVQLYLGSPESAGEPPQQLKGFEKVSLSPGETRHVTFSLTPDELSYWDTDIRNWVVPRGIYRIAVGSSSRDIRLTGSFAIASDIPPSDLANAALNRPVAVSSFWGAGFEAANAVDGDPTTMWRAGGSGEEWISADLGITREIGRVRLCWGPDFARSYSIQVSTDGSTWSEAYRTASGEGGIDDLPGLSGKGQFVRVKMTQSGTSGGYSLSAFEVYGPAQAGFGRWSRRLPGRVLAVDYDLGGEGIAYHYSTSSSEGNVYRTDGLNIQAAQDAGSGYCLGSLSDGEWLEYAVKVPDVLATHGVFARTAAATDGGRLRVRLDGTVLGTVPIPGTGGGQNWQTIQLPDVVIQGGGTRTLRLEIIRGGFNLNWIEFIQRSVCGTENLALNRPVTVSTTESNLLQGSNAVDGSPLTRWGSTPGSDPQWIAIDLGSVKNIGRVKLDWETSYARSYKIQISSDGNSWSDLYATTQGDGGIDDVAVSGTGRYVRIYGTERGSPWGYSLWEIEIYEALNRRPRRA